MLLQNGNKLRKFGMKFAPFLQCRKKLNYIVCGGQKMSLRSLGYTGMALLALTAPVFGQQKPREGWYVHHDFGTPTAVCRVYPAQDGIETTCFTRRDEMYANNGQLRFFRRGGPEYIQIGSAQECQDPQNLSGASAEQLIRSACLVRGGQRALEEEHNFAKVTGTVIKPDNIVSQGYAEQAMKSIRR